MTGLNRRHFLQGAGAMGAASFALSACSQAEEKDAIEQASQSEPLAEAIVAFDGEHQAGVDTDMQAHLNLVGFDLKPGIGKRGFRNLMSLWTEDARALCTGETPLGSLEPEMVDVPANLTITCGWGEPVFDKLGAGDLKPDWLRDIKPFSKDQLSDKWGQTDVVLQICCDDAVMASHAMRHMIRAGTDYAKVTWLQQGFANSFGSLPQGATHRNLFGQLDGTVNPRGEEEYDEQVWIDEGPDWAQGGTCMVVRRIRMNLDTWEKLDRATRENSVGRKLSNGAPLTGEEELDEADYSATDKYGLPVIDPNSHMARARPPADHPEQKLKRRPYSYDLMPDYAESQEEDLIQLSNAGLVFICFQKDPTRQFEPIQARLDEADHLNTWISHIGSAVYFVPPGTSSGGAGSAFWGSALLDAVR